MTTERFKRKETRRPLERYYSLEFEEKREIYRSCTGSRQCRRRPSDRVRLCSRRPRGRGRVLRYERGGERVRLGAAAAVEGPVSRQHRRVRRGLPPTGAIFLFRLSLYGTFSSIRFGKRRRVFWNATLTARIVSTLDRPKPDTPVHTLSKFHLNPKYRSSWTLGSCSRRLLR